MGESKSKSWGWSVEELEEKKKKIRSSGEDVSRRVDSSIRSLHLYSSQLFQSLQDFVPHYKTYEDAFFNKLKGADTYILGTVTLFGLSLLGVTVSCMDFILARIFNGI